MNLFPIAFMLRECASFPEKSKHCGKFLSEEASLREQSNDKNFLFGAKRTFSILSRRLIAHSSPQNPILASSGQVFERSDQILAKWYLEPSEAFQTDTKPP